MRPMQYAPGSTVDPRPTIHLDREACLRIQRAQHLERIEFHDALGLSAR